MAIYSLRMSSVGKTTQKQPFTAAAHLKYITRKEAVTHVLSRRMPGARRQAVAWLKREERADRKNARVIDKLVLALPRELSSAQQHALVEAFAEDLTQGRASWFAAFHTKGKDCNNPHCHLILRDRDIESGRRVMFLSAGQKEAAERREKGRSAPATVAAVRKLWEQSANAALAAAGRTERVDSRSLADQGVPRKPQVHEGPNIRAMHRRGFRPESKARVTRNSPHRRRGSARSRVVRYPEIDRGRTRAEYNDALRAGARASADARLPQVSRSSAVKGVGVAQFGKGVPAPAAPPPLIRTPDAAPPSAHLAEPMSLTERLAQLHGVAKALPDRSSGPARGR